MLLLRLFLAVAAVVITAAAQPNFSEKIPVITIRLYDYSAGEPATLAQARQQAADIFEKAGIRVRWQQCATAEETTLRSRACAQPVDVATIQLRILSREMSRKMARKSAEFGYAIALANGFGVFAGVYYERTIREADSVGLPRHIMLGHTIAHEIGHLLLGPNSHLGAGIMKANWGQREVHLAGMGSFLFTEAQARRIRMSTRKRIERAAEQWAERQRSPGQPTEVAALR